MRKELDVSSKRIGQLYPVLLDFYGNIIDGNHRLSVDRNWMKIRLQHVRSEKDALLAKIVSNNVRRKVARKEKTELVCRLAEIYEREGVERGSIAYKIAEETGMSYQWVMKYLPLEFKDPIYSENARFSTHHRRNAYRASSASDELKIKAYPNADCVGIMISKLLYSRLERRARLLNTTTAELLYNSILRILRGKNNRVDVLVEYNDR